MYDIECSATKFCNLNGQSVVSKSRRSHESGFYRFPEANYYVKFQRACAITVVPVTGPASGLSGLASRRDSTVLLFKVGKDPPLFYVAPEKLARQLFPYVRRIYLRVL